MDNNWLNRATKQLVERASAADMAERYGGDFSSYASNAEWIYDPVIPSGVPSKYLAITGDVVSEMDQTKRDAVNAAEKEARLDATMAELDAPGSLVGALMAVVLDLTGNTMTEAELKAAVRGKLGG